MRSRRIRPNLIKALSRGLLSQTLYRAKDKIYSSKKKQENFYLEGFYQIEEDYEFQPISLWRKITLILLAVICFSALISRLIHLQIVRGVDFRKLADSNRVQVKVIHAPRGVIYDRNGKLLAKNEPGFRLVDPNTTPTTIRYISRDEALAMELNNDPNLKNLEVDYLRSYPHGEVTAHILGYLTEITKEELGRLEFKNYRLGDKIGRGGVEQEYEKILKGVDGGEIIEVDSQGRPIRTLWKKPAVPGSNIVLSIDIDLQTQLFNSLKKGIEKAKSCCGAAIAQNPQTGEILALVSIPSFDPADLSLALNDPDSPFINRAIAGTYPPGSTFKMVSALAGLLSGKVDEKTEFEDTGIFRLGPYSFANWYFTQYGRTEGRVNLTKALVRSNDIYFYRLGDLVGEKVIEETAKKLHFGRKLGIDLPGEAEGLIPNAQWKKESLNQTWYPGDTLHMAIGQGYVLTTPLQISYLISVIANEGKGYRPHLIDKITSPEKQLIKDYEENPQVYPDIPQRYFQIIKEALAAVPKPGGTAWPFFNFTIPTGGKTGTAEFGNPQNKTHAWYTSFAPVNDPQIAVTVLIEAGGEGSSVAAPIVKEVYQWYFSPDKESISTFELMPVATQSARTLGE